jgi:hypothetical protein
LLSNPFQIADMALQLFENFSFQVRAAKYAHDTEQTINRGPVAPDVSQGTKVVHL